MKVIAALAAACLIALPVSATETLITKRKITDTISVRGMEKPLEIQNELTWVGKDRLRVDLGTWTTLVRQDTHKLYQINHETKTYSVVDLPFELAKYVKPEEVKKAEEALAKVTISITPTTETKKFKDWNATKYVMTMTVPGRGTFTEQIWAASEVGFDTKPWFDMLSVRTSLQPVGALMAAEQKKIVGIPVFVERSQVIGKNTFTGRDEIVSIESKDAPEGTFDLPKDYTEKPFELFDAAMKVRPPVEAEIVPIKPTPKDPPPPPAPK